MPIIGISGRRQHGKDTVCNMIQTMTSDDPFLVSYFKNFKESWEVVRFAWKLKQVSALLLGVDPAAFESEAFKKTPLPAPWGGTLTYRDVLQRLGTECARSIHPDFWINVTFADYKETDHFLCQAERKEDGYYYKGTKVSTSSVYVGLEEPSLPFWLMPDVRFPNEVDAIHKKGGFIIRVINRNMPEPANEHISEKALDGHPFQYIIYNEGTKADLELSVYRTLVLVKTQWPHVQPLPF